MDRKSLIVLFASFAVAILWIPLYDHFFPRPEPIEQTAGPTNAPVPGVSAPGGASLSPLDKPERILNAGPAPGPERTLVVTNDQAIYTFTSNGGGPRLIEMLRYPASVACDDKDAHSKEPFATVNTRAVEPTLALYGGQFFGADAGYMLSRTGKGVRAEKTLTNGLSIVKEFEFTSNYLMNARVRISNPTKTAARLPEREVVVGTSSLMNYQDSALLTGFFWYNGSKAEHITQSYFDNRTLGCFPGTPRAQYLAGDTNVVWLAAHNQFFTLAAVPREPAPRVIARKVDLEWDPSELPRAGAQIQPAVGFETGFLYPATSLNAGASLDTEYTIYAGPKEYNSLARIGAAQKNNLDLLMDFGFFGFASKALLLSMNGLNALGLPYGWAIICITVIIKLFFWPLTHASTRSMKRMQALQPQMKAIQEKYKEDPRKLQQKLMEFMRENKVSPLGGCLPMALQVPVFIGLYSMLRSAIELRGASFLWACDLSQPDTIAHIGFLGNFPINPLPLFMGATQLWQAQMNPPTPGMDPAQQKMMRYMPLMFIFLFYRTSAGLTLYWAVQNLLTILQMKVTKANDPVVPGPPAGLAAARRKK
jgi:YidC/Oxa1 family membrane protein insertase